jgi:hypothetical protein
MQNKKLIISLSLVMTVLFSTRFNLLTYILSETFGAEKSVIIKEYHGEPVSLTYIVMDGKSLCFIPGFSPKVIAYKLLQI